MKVIFLIGFVFILSIGFSQNKRFEKFRAECKEDTCVIAKLHKYYLEIRYANSDSAFLAVAEEMRLSNSVSEKKYILFAWMDAADYYCSKQEFSRAMTLSDSALSLAIELNEKQIICNLYNLIGIIYSDQSDYEKSIEYYQKEITLASAINFRSGLSQAYSNIGVSFYQMADYGKAIDYYLKSLKILEEDKDTVKISIALSNLSVFYQMKKQYSKSLEMSQKALAYCKKDDLFAQTGALNNISVTYGMMEDFEKSLEYANKTIELQKIIGDKRGLATSYNNIGGLYARMKKNELALVNIKMAIELSEEANLPIEISHYKRALAICYLNMKNYKPALESALKSTEIARQQNIRKTVVENYSLIADIYWGLKDYKNSAEYFFKYRALNDSLVAEEFEESIAEMDAKYQSHKRQKEIELLTKDKKVQAAELKQQATQRNALIAGLILGLLLIIVVARSYFQKKKDNKLLTSRNEEILQQKEEIAAQRDEISVQHEIVVKQKEHIEEIHLEVSQSIDYATRIQSAILSDPEVLKKTISDFFVLFKPKDKVSGDFYWWAEIEGQTIITVADCTGHGVPGAFMSMLGISFLREIVVKEYISNPGLILKKLRKEIIHALKQKGESGEQKDGMDMALICINHTTLEMQFAGANNPCWIVGNSLSFDSGQKPDNENNQLLELKADKMPIAIYERLDPFTNHVVQLRKGDLIYLMSDGYEDQFGGAKNKKFKSKNLKDLLVQNSHLTMAEQQIIIEKTFENWRGDYEQVDDVTIIGIKV